MNRIDEKLLKRSDNGVGALLPYFTAGYPSAELFGDLLIEADRLGAAVIEVGLPFSDSIADGPVIQGSFNHVLDRGQSLDDVFGLLARLRPKLSCGLVAMGSYSLIYKFGCDSFLKRAAEVGFDGVLIPDMPAEESAVAREAANELGLRFIGLVAPTTMPDRLGLIVSGTSGFVYQVAVAGTTGERAALAGSLADQVGRVRALTSLPVCVGFGVATAEHVRQVCRVADGAIVGSAIVRRITEALEQKSGSKHVVAAISSYLSSLFSALSPGATS